MRVVKLNNKDSQTLDRLCDLYNEVFNEDLAKPEPLHFENLLSNANIIFFVVLNENDEVVGGLTAHKLPNIHFTEPEIYIYDFAVKNNLQRTGIGTFLMNEFLIFCKTQNYKEVFVQADKEDNHAVKFYKKSGGVEEDVFYYSFPLK